VVALIEPITNVQDHTKHRAWEKYPTSNLANNRQTESWKARSSTSGYPVIQAQSREAPLTGCERGACVADYTAKWFRTFATVPHPLS
jgi:hypothetical protein